MTPKKAKPKSAKSATAKKNKSSVFTAEEKAAMKELVKERKADARMSKDRAAGESALLAKIAEMREPDRSMAKRIHAIVKDNAPALAPKTWYGMPAYANPDGKVVCFFQAGQKFNARYSTFGFNDSAHLDEDTLWPVAFALTELTPTAEARITALVKKAAK
jgi:uncharacterized protein YdhG (YjbR/CyaY superfamily)